MAVRSEDLGKTGTLAYPSRIKLPYVWYAGKAGSRFYQELKDHCRIYGTRCPDCSRVYVPPRETCPRCYRLLDDWVEVGNTGTLLTFTVTRYAVAGIQPRQIPFAIGIVKLDGASSGLVHLCGGADVSELRVGMRMQAVFRERREGNYLDIEHFAPLRT
ncbi:MAG: Zn-ribbon domain-containing OB-fold protein [Dehalococcoidia bacterium]|nr:Zn-ribbon domain-containing OB-fold protein [Dehalococcoidia bacterium]